MERESHDVNTTSLSDDQIHEMEEKRIVALNEAGIDEAMVLSQCNENLNIWNSHFNENITRGKDDVNFLVRDQWTAVERSEFTRLFKPAMVANNLYDSVKKIVGEERKNKPNLIVRSLNGKASQEEINFRTDLVRTIAYQSQNDLVYQTAFKSALCLGFGAFQILLDYENPLSFNKIPRYDLITDPTMCSWDPVALLPHKGDGSFCARRFVMKRDEFFATYPYVENPVSFIDPYMLLDFQWTTRDTITICDEFIKEWFPLVIYRLSNGEVVTKEQWKAREKLFEDNKELVKDAVVGEIIAREIPKIIGERQTQDYRIMHYRMTKDRIIDFSQWPSKQLPIPFVDGDSYYIEGRQYTKSFIHEARDVQKGLNYSFSELMSEIKNRRREQWLATPDNVIGNEQQWRNPELQMGALIARPDPKTGMMPTKMPAWEVSPGLFNMLQICNQQLNQILGFSEQEQMIGKDVSGKARRERRIESSMSAYVFFDNFHQAVAQGGRIVNDLLDHIIGDEERHMVVTRKDGKSEPMIINQRMRDGKIANQLVKGEFDVEIDSGPSFAVQKDIALEFFQQTVANNPQVFNLIADLWAGNLDIQQMEQVKERLQTLVPPQILAKEQGKQLPPQPPSPQEQLMQQQIQMQQAKIQEAQGQLQIKMQELELKKQQQQLDQAKLMLEAHKVQADNQLNLLDHSLNVKKAEIVHGMDGRRHENDLSAKLAGILANLHESEKQREHEKEMNKHKA